MSFLCFRRIMTKPITELRISRQIRQRFFFKDLKEVVRKREEFRVKLLSAQKNEDVNGDVKKYQHYLDVLNWVINSNENT